jgi:class 3 adenylate cyclase
MASAGAESGSGTTRLVGGFLRILAALLALAALLVLFAFAIPYLPEAGAYPWVRKVGEIDEQTRVLVKSIVPTRIGGFEAWRWILLAFLLICRTVLLAIAGGLSKRALTQDVEALRKGVSKTGQAAMLDPLKEQIEHLKPGDTKSRAHLLEVMAETKKKLESMGRDLAFLSIDVVGSTQMKEGESKTDVEYDFHEYRKLVEAKMQSNGALKAAWTPDGVMICFPNVDAAVRMAQELIQGLVAFNKNVKTMRTDFQVRCGINAGRVYYDEKTPMETMSDRVIDVAGHMQKYALPGTIAIAKPSIEPVRQRDGFEPSGKVVDGYDVYHWRGAD